VFTGLIQATGTIQRHGDYAIQVFCQSHAPAILEGLALGDSVAVDGVCLTVSQLFDQGFVAAVSPETLRRTTLGAHLGDYPVNLEPSLRVGSKLGGHFVTGHIDGLGYLEAATETATSWEMRFCVSDERVARYIVPKGSIAVNGISLTVAACDGAGSWFQVAVIPVTYTETNLRLLQPGDPVNLEGDVLGKYVEKFVRLGSTSSARPSPSDILTTPMSDDLTADFLAEHGYSHGGLVS